MDTPRISLDEVLASDRLPSAPSVAMRLLDLLEDPEVSTGAIVEAVRADPALAARILRGANSAYFGFPSEVRTLEQGVSLIGRTVITSLALSFYLAEEAMGTGALAEDFRRYWVRSLVQGSAAELLARNGAASHPAELFTMGLLLDLGQLAMLKVLGRRYAELVRREGRNGDQLCRCEAEELGVTHPEVGAELMARWGLPQSMIGACRAHHEPPAEGLVESEGDGLLPAMQVATAVGDWYGGGSPAEELARLADRTERLFGFSETALLRFLMETDARIPEAAELFPASPPILPSAADLMGRASEQLASVAIQQDRERQRASSLRDVAEARRAELEAQNESLRRQVFLDPLTGVHSRRFFDTMFEHEAARAARIRVPLSVLFVDVDRFKNVNDAWGHGFGDRVLTAIGDAMRQCVRRSDIVARYGGEEFVVLARETGERGLLLLGERVRDRVEALELSPGNERVPVTVSVGGATRAPDSESELTPRRLMELADQALYESKARGRNRVTIRTATGEVLVGAGESDLPRPSAGEGGAPPSSQKGQDTGSTEPDADRPLRPEGIRGWLSRLVTRSPDP